MSHVVGDHVVRNLQDVHQRAVYNCFEVRERDMDAPPDAELKPVPKLQRDEHERVQAWRAVQQGNIADVERFLEQQPPESRLFEWTVDAASTSPAASAAVPFDRLMWREALAAQLAVDGRHRHAAEQLKKALQELSSWSARGVEIAHVAHEPRVYARYCHCRAKAALHAMEERGGNGEYASYAALCAGVAHALMPHVYSRETMRQALAMCYKQVSVDARTTGERVGALRLATRFGADPALLDAACKRNAILLQPEVEPSAVPPRCIGIQ